MPRPGPERRNLVVRVSEPDRQAIVDLAATMPLGPRSQPNLSDAVRRIITEWTTCTCRPREGDQP